MESVLITGASGFIGSFIVEEALKRKLGVWAGIRPTSSKRYLKNRKIHFLELDFAHPNELRAQLSGHKGTYSKFDYIIHCAGVTKCSDKKTFDFLFKEYYPQLYYYAFHLINNMEASKDIVSDAFEFIWANYAKIDKATAKSYLYVYVRNKSIDFLRHHIF